jgi:hypothetical protein
LPASPPLPARRLIFRLALFQNLEIHKVFLRFFNFPRQKIFSTI